MRPVATRVSIVVLLLGLLSDGASAAPPLTRACAAPPLPPPSGSVVEVATERQLQAAVKALTSGTTILIRPGTYVLTSTLWLTRNVQNVAIRGGTNSCHDVVLVGQGMNNASYGAVPHGIFVGNTRKLLVANHSFVHAERRQGSR